MGGHLVLIEWLEFIKQGKIRQIDYCVFMQSIHYFN